MPEDSQTTSKSLAGVDEIHAYLVEQLHSALRRPGMSSQRDAALRMLVDHLLFVECQPEVWAEEQRSWASRGAGSSTGLAGMFQELMPGGYDQNCVASVYAQLAHRRGWLRPDRLLLADEHYALRARVRPWAQTDRSWADVLSEFGPPSIAYTDRFFQARRREPMSVAAEMQWSLLPPLTMSVPQVSVSGAVEPAYGIAGDSFDYALNDEVLHATVIDAMGHGLDAATMATVTIGAYRHARRSGIDLPDMYAYMDQAVADQFGPDHFVTAQMMRLDVTTGLFQWVNAGHHAPLLIRQGAVRGLESPTTLPVGLGGERPTVSEYRLQRGDRVLCYTDGVIEERNADGEQFGEDRLIRCLRRIGNTEGGMRSAALTLSRTLKEERGGRTSDDATVLLIEWRGRPADHLTTLE